MDGRWWRGTEANGWHELAVVEFEGLVSHFAVEWLN
jgi:hypothetical protein